METLNAAEMTPQEYIDQKRLAAARAAAFEMEQLQKLVDELKAASNECAVAEQQMVAACAAHEEARKAQKSAWHRQSNARAAMLAFAEM